MTVFILTKRSKHSPDRKQVFQDPNLQTGNILIDQDNYDSSLDRIYDVNELDDMHIKIKNTGGANGLTYTVQITSKEVQDLNTLVDADFTTLKGDTNVAFGTDSQTDIVNISPQTKAVRVRIKRQAAGNDTTLAGFVAVN